MTGLDAFDKAIHKANQWLKQIMEELGWDNRHKAYVALRAVLHALRDRLTVDEAVQMGAQLPMILRGIYFEGWDPSQTPVKDRRKEAFLMRVSNHLPPLTDIVPEEAAAAVFAVLARHVSEGEIDDVKRILPKDFHELWPEPE